MPSEAKRSQSPGAQSSARKTSGTGETLAVIGATAGSLNPKSPSPRLTAKAPSMREGPRPE
eukprot:9144943-Alexandrium_andersonii.AAC.1